MSLLCRFSFLFAILGSHVAVAQWGIQGTFLHHEQMTGRHGLHWTVGFAHDVSERSSIGLDVIGHLNPVGDDNFSEQHQYGGYTVDYRVNRKVFGAQYRSTFFLVRDNSGLYLGPYLGFRSISRPITFTYAYSSDYSTSEPAWGRSSTTRALIFPVGLRLGFRSELDGYFGDIYVGIGSQLGNGKEKNVPVYLADKDKLKGFSFQVGYSVGIGWE